LDISKFKSFSVWSAGILPASTRRVLNDSSRFALMRARMPALQGACRSQIGNLRRNR
jgi:hypothetical protein